MEDVDSYPFWFSDCAEARILKADSPQDRDVYFVQSASFPFSDRDMITHFHIEQAPGTKTITMTLRGLSQYLPPVPHRVRVPRIEGKWEFAPKDDGIIDVTYQVRSDPGGYIPDWLANVTVGDGPWNTLRGLRARLLQDKYKNARLPWVQD